MAAIICRAVFIEPCRALGRCINAACRCCGDVCDEIGKCCDYVCQIFEKPFAGCLFISVGLNIAALIYGFLSLTSGTYSEEDCDVSSGTMDIYLIALMILSILNGVFAYYVFYSMNTDEMRLHIDPKYAAEQGESVPSNIGQKTLEFFQYNVYFALYICFVFVPTIVFVSLGGASRCPNSTKSTGLYWTGMLLVVFLAIGFFIMFTYMFVEAMKQWSQNCWLWCFPCLWPCLLIGVCVNMFEPQYGSQPPPTQADRQAQASRPVRGAPAYGKGSQKGPQSTNTNGYNNGNNNIHANEPLVAVAVAQPQYNSQANNNNNNNNNYNPGIAPHYTNGGPSAPPSNQYNNASAPSAPPESNQTNSMQYSNANNNNNNNNDPGQQKDAKEVAVGVAKAGGAMAVAGGKKAIGWAAKGLNKLNNKLNENNNNNNNNNNKQGGGGGGEGEGQPGYR